MYLLELIHLRYNSQSGLTQAQSGLTQAQSGLTQAQSGLTQAQSGLTQAQSGLTQAGSYAPFLKQHNRQSTLGRCSWEQDYQRVVVY